MPADSPILPMVGWRYATRDMRFGGQDIRAGDMLILGLAAANADPEVLPADSTPVVGNRSHLAFGAGPHTCPAQGPARLITRTAVDTIRHRLPDLEVSFPESELKWVNSPWGKGLGTLPVRFASPQLPRGPVPSRAAEAPAPAWPHRNAVQTTGPAALTRSEPVLPRLVSPSQDLEPC